MLVAFGSVSITSIFSLHRLGEELGVIGECYLPLTKAVAQLESFHKNKERDTDRILAEKDRSTERVLMGYTRVYFPRMMRERVLAARAVITRAQRIARGGDLAFLLGMDGRLGTLYERYGDYNEAATELYRALERDPASQRSAHGGAAGPRPAVLRPTGMPRDGAKAKAALDPIAERGRELKQVEGLIGREVQLLSTALESRVARRVNDVHRSEVRAAWAIIALTLMAILVGLLATGLAQRTLQPIRVLTEGVKGISRGDFAREVQLHSRDELGLLAREFNAMAASLRERERQLLTQRERLLRSERLAAIGRVSAQITHEIRNPLSSIGLNAELLADDLAAATFDDPAKRTEALTLLAAMAREIDRLTEISEQYLAFARPPHSGQGPLEEPGLALPLAEVPVELGELALDLLGFLAPELAQAHIEVKLDLVPELPPVLGDEGQLRQALLNLVRNAREAMAPAGGLLTIRIAPGDASAAPGARQLTLEVTDEGPGVPEDALSRLFDPFFSTKEQGTGLGLALTQRIAADHGGTLRCESPPGRGATFTLTLPIRGEPERPGVQPAASPGAHA